MAQTTGKVHKKSQGNHDGCADCLRQKKENEAFIKIYERLQQVDKKTNRMRVAVNDHKNSSETNRSFYHSYEQKITNLPKVKEKDNPQQMQFAGYEIAASLIQKQSKSKLIAQNQRLREMLFKMQKEKNQSRPSFDIKPRLNQNSIILSESSQKLTDSLSLSFNSEINRQSVYSNQSSLQNLASSQQTSDSCKDNSSTQSSSFNLSKTRNSMDLSKYNDLNLWLYQSQKHAKLQEELFLGKKGTNRSFISKRNTSILPSIKK